MTHQIALDQQILAAVQSATSGPGALHEPVLGDAERRHADACIASGWVSYAGSYVTQFESALAAITGAKHVIAMTSGTAALHVCLMMADAGPGDEVLVPAFTFVASANAIAHAGAHPHFIDIDVETLGVDAPRLAAYLERICDRQDGAAVNRITGREIKALVCVHTFGHAADMAALSLVCADFGITLIEDAAESLGTYINGRHTGTFGQMAALSFNGNKIVTTGGGGAVMTDDDAIAATIRHLTTTAKQPHKWEFIHDMVGYNYRMPAINAALGVAQLEQFEAFLKRKRALANAYAEAFAHVPGVKFLQERTGTSANYWLNTLILDNADIETRDGILATLNDAGYGSRPAWRPMHLLAPFADAPRDDLSVSEDLYRRVISIPSGVGVCPPC